MVLLNSFFNPIIYSFRLREFRVAFIELICKTANIAEAELREMKIFGTPNAVVRIEAGQENEGQARQNVEQWNKKNNDSVDNSGASASAAQPHWKEKRHKWKGKVQKSTQFCFCGQTKAFRKEIVLRGIPPCFLHGGALGLFWTKRTKAPKFFKKFQVHSVLYNQGKYFFKRKFKL